MDTLYSVSTLKDENITEAVDSLTISESQSEVINEVNKMQKKQAHVIEQAKIIAEAAMEAAETVKLTL